MIKIFTKTRSIYRGKKNRENRKKSIFWTIFLFFVFFRLVSMCRYETSHVSSYGIGKPWKKKSTKICWIYRRTKNRENGTKLDKKQRIFQKFDFFRFSRFFLRRYIERIFVKTFISVYLYIPYEQTQRVSYLQIEINRKEYSSKLDKNRKNVQKFDFFWFSRFFTTIYWADFFDNFFHGLPILYEQTQGVSYLQIETNWK